MTIQRFLKEEDYILFREGMILRQHHIKRAFGNTDILVIEENLLRVTDQYAVVATDKLLERMPDSFEYYPELLVRESPDILELYLNGEDLVGSVLNNLPKNDFGRDQIIQAFRSGVLKYDTRGYYLDRKGRILLDIYLEESGG